jgi:hypothetical protein
MTEHLDKKTVSMTNDNTDLFRLIDKVHSLGSDQMEYYMNIALEWISRKKDESVYLTDFGLSIDDCPHLDRGYQCGVKGLSNSDIIRWISPFASLSDPLREMMKQVMDTDDHPFSKLRNDSLQIAKCATYPHQGRQNAIQKGAFFIAVILVRLSFLLRNAGIVDSRECVDYGLSLRL